TSLFILFNLSKSSLQPAWFCHSDHIDQQSEFNNRIEKQLEKLESVLGLQTDIAIHQAEQSKIVAKRMDRIEITMYEIKTSLKAIQPRNQPGKLAMSEASILATRPEKGKAPARPDTYPPVNSVVLS
ncbi:BgTH12-01879, partial [Blumeria graminis f. sp. triticale]